MSAGGKRRRDSPTRAEGEPGPGPGSVPEVGRLVDSSQADDRRMIRLVQARPLLYARSNMPVASYYSQVKTLWQEVADEMGWTVADVRRKWSHVRNSYSRHLRNELYGVRTGRGRAVSRWYLADELAFLRDHMATDTRPPRYSYPALYAAVSSPPKAEPPADADAEPFLQSPWFSALAGQAPEPAPEPLVHLDECSSRGSLEPDDNGAYFQFFRGIYSDYQELSARKQRLFRRECLALLHQLLDAQDAGPTGLRAHSDDERDSKTFVVDKPSDQPHSILPN